MKFYETAKALAPLALKFLQTTVGAAVLVVSTAYIPRETKQRANQFVQDCVSQMSLSTQALIESDPRNLEPNLQSMLYKRNIPGYPALQERLGNIRAEISMISGLRDYLQKSEQRLAARASRAMVSLGKIQVWALKRQLLKIYADATWS